MKKPVVNHAGKRGEWLHSGITYSPPAKILLHKCSECGVNTFKAPYCGFCGARNMKYVEVNDEDPEME